MDPRDAAKITNPDLTKAFSEGHGMTEEQLNPPDTAPKVYLLLLQGEKVLGKKVLAFAEFDVALAMVTQHLKFGGERGAVIVVQVLEPEGWELVPSSISASE